jgi:ABC-type transporter Mla subunit MlaD
MTSFIKNAEAEVVKLWDDISARKSEVSTSTTGTATTAAPNPALLEQAANDAKTAYDDLAAQVTSFFNEVKPSLDSDVATVNEKVKAFIATLETHL